MQSGGKDALSVLDLCSQVFTRIVCVYHYWAPDIRCLERPVLAAVARAKCELIMLPHPAIAGYFKEAVVRWDNASSTVRAKTLTLLKPADVDACIRRTTGIDWIANGMRADESMFRAAFLRRCGGIQPKSRKVYPLWDWTSAMARNYLLARRIPIPESFGGDRGEISPDGPSMVWLQDNHPDDFERWCRVYPHAEALALHHRLHGKDRRKRVKAPGPG